MDWTTALRVLIHCGRMCRIGSTYYSSNILKKKCSKWSFVNCLVKIVLKSSFRISERGVCSVQSGNWKAFGGNYVIIGFSYKTMTMLWCFNFLWMWTCWSLCVLFFDFNGKTTMWTHFRSLGEVVPHFIVCDCWLFPPLDFRLRGDVWLWPAVGHDSIVEGQESVRWSWFSARPKFKPSEDFVQLILCHLWLLGSLVGTRFAVWSCVLSWPLWWESLDMDQI
jgi:hypothetical protein